MDGDNKKVDEAVKSFDEEQQELSIETNINALNIAILTRKEVLDILSNVLSAGLQARDAAGDKLARIEVEAMQKAVDVEQKKTVEMFEQLKTLCNTFLNKK